MASRTPRPPDPWTWRLDVDAQAAAQRAARGRAGDAVEALYRRAMAAPTPEAGRDLLLEGIGGIGREWSRVAAVLAADFYDSQRAQWQLGDRYRAGVADVFDAGAEHALQRSARRLAGGLFTDDPETAIAGLRAAVGRPVMQSGRRTMIDADKRDPKKARWARVPSGGACKVCVMLASKGFAYRSAEAAANAGTLAGSSHSRCHCQIVCSWAKGHPELAGYDPAALRKQWRFMEYRDTITEPAGVDPPKADPYWRARQAALRQFGFDGAGEVLEPGEIRFVERMLHRGERVKWLATPSLDPVTLMIPSGKDFRWLSRDGGEWQLKSPASAKYSSVRRKIGEALAKGQADVIVDLGGETLTDELAQAVARYAIPRNIRQLVLLSGDGSTLTTIK